MLKEKQDVIVAIIMGSLFILLFGFITFLVVINYVKRKRKMLLERERQEAQYQQAVLRAQLEMQDHTFKVISQDIHDNVGQILGLIKLNLNILTLNEKDNEMLNNLKELVTSATADLRDLGSGYYADRLIEKGLVAAIRHQIRQLEKTGMFTVSFYSEINDLSIDKNKIIFLYRMVQESLNNIMKHSGADLIEVVITKHGDDICIRITDNGKGFNANDKEFIAGIGLSSIQERAAIIQAKTEIISTHGKGTSISFTFKQSNL